MKRKLSYGNSPGIVKIPLSPSSSKSVITFNNEVTIVQQATGVKTRSSAANVITANQLHSSRNRIAILTKTPQSSFSRHSSTKDNQSMKKSMTLQKASDQKYLMSRASLSSQRIDSACSSSSRIRQRSASLLFTDQNQLPGFLGQMSPNKKNSKSRVNQFQSNYKSSPDSPHKSPSSPRLHSSLKRNQAHDSSVSFSKRTVAFKKQQTIRGKKIIRKFNNTNQSTKFFTENQLSKSVEIYQNRIKQGNLLTQMQIEYAPTPEERLIKKYDYFYRAYNYEANPNRSMTFGDENEPEALLRLQNLIDIQNHTKELSVDGIDDHQIDDKNDLNSQIFDAKCQLVQNQGKAGWQEVNQFLFESDPRAIHFVMNQMRQITGQKTHKMKQRKRRKVEYHMSVGLKRGLTLFQNSSKNVNAKLHQQNTKKLSTKLETAAQNSSTKIIKKDSKSKSSMSIPERQKTGRGENLVLIDIEENLAASSKQRHQSSQSITNSDIMGDQSQSMKRKKKKDKTGNSSTSSLDTSSLETISRDLTDESEQLKKQAEEGNLHVQVIDEVTEVSEVSVDLSNISESKQEILLRKGVKVSSKKHVTDQEQQSQLQQMTKQQSILKHYDQNQSIMRVDSSHFSKKDQSYEQSSSSSLTETNSSYLTESSKQSSKQSAMSDKQQQQVQLSDKKQIKVRLSNELKQRISGKIDEKPTIEVVSVVAQHQTSMKRKSMKKKVGGKKGKTIGLKNVVNRASTSSFPSKDGDLPSRKESMNVITSANKNDRISKSSTQRIIPAKKVIDFEKDEGSDSHESKQTYEWMCEQEKREVRKHNAMKKNRQELKIQKQKAQQLKKSAASSMIQKFRSMKKQPKRKQLSQQKLNDLKSIALGNVSQSSQGEVQQRPKPRNHASQINVFKNLTQLSGPHFDTFDTNKSNQVQKTSLDKNFESPNQSSLSQSKTLWDKLPQDKQNFTSMALKVDGSQQVKRKSSFYHASSLLNPSNLIESRRNNRQLSGNVINKIRVESLEKSDTSQQTSINRQNVQVFKSNEFVMEKQSSFVSIMKNCDIEKSKSLSSSNEEKFIMQEKKLNLMSAKQLHDIQMPLGPLRNEKGEQQSAITSRLNRSNIEIKMQEENDDYDQKTLSELNPDLSQKNLTLIGSQMFQSRRMSKDTEIQVPSSSDEIKAEQKKQKMATIVLRNKKFISDNSTQILKTLRTSQNKQPVLKFAKIAKKINKKKKNVELNDSKLNNELNSSKDDLEQAKEKVNKQLDEKEQKEQDTTKTKQETQQPKRKLIYNARMLMMETSVDKPEEKRSKDSSKSVSDSSKVNFQPKVETIIDLQGDEQEQKEQNEADVEIKEKVDQQAETREPLISLKSAIKKPNELRSLQEPKLQEQSQENFVGSINIIKQLNDHKEDDEVVISMTHRENNSKQPKIPSLLQPFVPDYQLKSSWNTLTNTRKAFKTFDQSAEAIFSCQTTNKHNPLRASGHLRKSATIISAVQKRTLLAQKRELRKDHQDQLRQSQQQLKKLDGMSSTRTGTCRTSRVMMQNNQRAPPNIEATLSQDYNKMLSSTNVSLQTSPISSPRQEPKNKRESKAGKSRNPSIRGVNQSQLQNLSTCNESATREGTQTTRQVQQTTNLLSSSNQLLNMPDEFAYFTRPVTTSDFVSFSNHQLLQKQLKKRVKVQSARQSILSPRSPQSSSIFDQTQLHQQPVLICAEKMKVAPKTQKNQSGPSSFIFKSQKSRSVKQSRMGSAQHSYNNQNRFIITGGTTRNQQQMFTNTIAVKSPTTFLMPQHHQNQQLLRPMKDSSLQHLYLKQQKQAGGGRAARVRLKSARVSPTHDNLVLRNQIVNIQCGAGKGLSKATLNELSYEELILNELSLKPAARQVALVSQTQRSTPKNTPRHSNQMKQMIQWNSNWQQVQTKLQ